MIYWLYGQPGSGKTTLAKELVYHLDNDLIGNQIRGPYKTVHIDGDGLREIFNNKDYSKEGREKNLRDVNKLIRFLDDQGFSVVVSVVAPYMDIRDEILDLNPIMIYLHTSETRGKEDYFADEEKHRCIKCSDECNGCYGPNYDQCSRCRNYRI